MAFADNALTSSSPVAASCPRAAIGVIPPAAACTESPGTGEIAYDFLFAHLDRLGYDGWIGCEYKPATTTAAGLGWLQRYAL